MSESWLLKVLIPMGNQKRARAAGRVWQARPSGASHKTGMGLNSNRRRAVNHDRGCSRPSSMVSLILLRQACRKRRALICHNGISTAPIFLHVFFWASTAYVVGHLFTWKLYFDANDITGTGEGLRIVHYAWPLLERVSRGVSWFCMEVIFDW